MILDMVILVSLMLLYQYWLRDIFFFRVVKNLHPCCSNFFNSPVDGTLVYVRTYNGSGQDIYGKKLEDDHYCGKTEESCHHIGVYMTVFDRHYVCAPVDCEIIQVEHWKAKTNYPMLDLIEYTNVNFRRKFSDWFNRHNKWILRNERVVVTCKDKIKGYTFKIIMIGDKYVNKILVDNKKTSFKCGEPFAQIKRGSQTDLIVPTRMFNNVSSSNLSSQVGKKVKIGNPMLRNISNVF